MGEPLITDQDARERAIDPTGSFIVQAPAGSGKTELLIQRFLALLAVVREPEEILAITFTRKAAAEMRSRVVQALLRGQDELAPSQNHERQTWSLAQAALKQDAACGWKLTEMPGRLRIQTIDSLCHSLTRQMPVTSEMGGVVNVVDDASELYQEAARSALAEMDSDDTHARPVNVLLEHLGNRVDEAERLLVTMLEKRGHWLSHVVADQQRAVLEDALRAAVEEQLAVVAGKIPSDAEAEVVALRKFAAANLSIPSVLHAFPSPVGDDLLAWKEVADLLQTMVGTWRRRADKREGFPASEAGREMKTRLLDLIESLSSVAGLEGALAVTKSLPEVRYTSEQWKVLQALFSLLNRATAHLAYVFAVRGTLDHQAVQEKALRSLGDDLAPTDLAERIDYAIHHILVDEFQDTSRGQFALLQGLIEGWTQGDGRTLFLVGDPMQSIYRFREAEVALFLKAERDGIGDLPLQPLTLRRNFRSRQEIVDWANRAFPSVLPEISDAKKGAVCYSSCDSMRGDGGSVHVHPFFDRDRTGEAARVVNIVSDRLPEMPDPAAKIAILARSRAHLSAIVPALREAGIPFQGKDLEKLGERPEVQDLLALTRALLHPGDRTAWLALLRAPWCGLTLADLATVFSEQPYRTTPDLLADDRVVSKLSTDGQDRLARTLSVIDKAWKERRRRPLARWVEGVWLALGGPATTASPVAMGSARAFFALLEELEQGGDILDFAALEEGVDTIFAPPDPSEGIQVELMTMHGAKGLEFDTVILPGLGRTTGRDSKQLLMWLDRPTQIGKGLLMAPVKGSFQSDQDPIYAFIQQLGKEHANFEHGRLLYVAATRAREHLHLLGHVAWKPEKEESLKPMPGTLLEKLWPAIADVFAREVPAIDAEDSRPHEDAVRPLPQELHRFSSTWRIPSPPESAPLSLRAAFATDREPPTVVGSGDSSARHVGTVVHLALMRIARDSADRWEVGAVGQRKPLWKSLLIDKGVALDNADALANRVVDALERTISDERGRWILESREQAVSEYDMTAFVDGSPRRFLVDRTFVDDGTRWIIDFKTGAPGEESAESFLNREKELYKDQLERYARLFENEGIPIRLALYFPMTAGWIEWAFEAQQWAT